MIDMKIDSDMNKKQMLTISWTLNIEATIDVTIDAAMQGLKAAKAKR